MEQKKLTKEENFVNHLIQAFKNDKGFKADMKAAYPTTTSLKVYDYLYKWCDMDKEYLSLPYLFIAADMAKTNPKENGKLPLGTAFRIAYTDNGEFRKETALPKMQMLLTCRDLKSLLIELEWVLELISSRHIVVDYVLLLTELKRFKFSQEKIKKEWALCFLGKVKDEVQ